MKRMWFGCGLGLGVATLSIALGSVPGRGRVTDDTVIYENLSEIRVPKQGDLNFDTDIARLASIEGRYRENLPTLRAPHQAAMKRIAEQKYRYGGSSGRAGDKKTSSR